MRLKPKIALFALVCGRIVSAGENPQTGIAFDQIDRVLHGGEVPKEGDTFASDAAVIAALPPLEAHVPTPRGMMARNAGNMLVSTALGMIPLAGPIIAGASSRALSAAHEAAEKREWDREHAAVARFVSAGTLSHFAFYGDWVRGQRGNQITIIKPDHGVTLVLDAATKPRRPSIPAKPSRLMSPETCLRI